MVVRRCKGCGGWVQDQWHCDECKARQGKRPTPYGGAHQAKRKREKPYMYGTPCCRCGKIMEPGSEIWLDHNDNGIGYLGWSHKRCNLGARNRYHGRRARAARVKVQIEREAERDPGLIRPDGLPPRQHARQW
jgi:hypothetical protein